MGPHPPTLVSIQLTTYLLILKTLSQASSQACCIHIERGGGHKEVGRGTVGVLVLFPKIDNRHAQLILPKRSINMDFD